MTADCKRCTSNGNPKVPAALVAYWGDPLCRTCAAHVATLLDIHDRWPAVPWTTDDEELIS